jgi:glycosyltransferase involved in cell wall biosynthesis
MKISIAIPTIAGRGKYLASCLQTCISQDSDEIEILVSDNSDGEAEELCRSIKDKRVRYIRPPRYLSMSDHWDFVLQNAVGDSISFIGDDDGLMPGSIDVLLRLFRNVGNVPIHHSMANYHWPDFPVEHLRNRVDFFHPVSSRGGWKSCSAFLSELALAQTRYVDGPMIYHNFVPLALVQSLGRDGSFFKRSSPDMYSAIAVAANTERFYSVESLLTISGQGARANGASVKSGGEDGSKFLQEAASNERHVPRFKSRTIQMHLLDSILEVARTYGAGSIPGEISYEKHLWKALIEAGRLPGWSAKLEEFGCLLAIAHQYEKKALLSREAWTALQRFAFGVKQVETSAGEGRPTSAATPPPLLLGNEISNIYSASLAIDIVLQRHCAADI